MQKQRKRKNSNNHKILKLFSCFIIILLMIVSMMPENMLFAEPNSDIDQTTEVTNEQQEVQQEEKELRGTQDLSKQTELLKWQIDTILMNGNEEKPIIIKSNEDILDLSKTDAETIKELQLLVILQISEITDERYLQKGDTLSISLPNEFVIDEVKEPVAIFTYDQKTYEEYGLREENKNTQIGEYTIDEQHIVHITFTQAVTKETMSNVFAILPITFSLPKDQQDVTTITFPLQEENKNLTILLPVQKIEEIKKDESKEEQLEKDSSKEETKTEPNVDNKDQPVSDNKTNTEQEKETETVEKTDEEEPANKEEIKEEVNIDGNLKPNTIIKNTLIRTMRIFPSNVQNKIMQTFASSPYKETILTGLPDGFESVKISVMNKNGGYTIDSNDKTVGFKFNLLLSDGFLSTELERVLSTMPNAPVFNGNGLDYDKDVLKFLNNEDVQKELSKLEYTFDLGEVFHNFNSDKREDLVESNEKVGEYWVEKGIVHVLFSYEMYYYSGVSAGFNFDAKLNDDVKLDENPHEVIFENDKLVFKQTGSINGGDTPADVVKYSVDKDAPLTVDEPEINYTIDVKAKTTDENLDDKYFSDKIPAGLQVKNFYFIDSDGNEKEIDEYMVENGELLYKISGKDVKEISFHLILEADNITYQNLIKAGSMNQPFTNTASLKDSENKEELAVSDEVSTNMKVTFLKKEGKQQDLEGTKFNWTIQADTKLSLYDKGYLIDTFAYSDHMLANGTSLTITFGGETDIFDIDKIKKIESNIPYTDLTVEEISKMNEEGFTDPFYYIYETETDSKFNNEKVKQCVLIIPFDNYHGTKSSKKVKIQYITELNLHGLSIDEYLQNHSDNAKGIGNIVNLLWTNTGKGPGPAVWEDVVNFSKDVDTNVDVMDKKGVYYDPVTQQTYWNLEVNRMGAVVNPLDGAKDITIIDTFDKGAYELSSFKLTYTKYNRETGETENVNLDTDQTKNEYYEIAHNGNDSQIIIHMPQLGVNDYRIYHIQAKLKDANSLNQQGKISISNKAKINANVNNNPVKTDIEAKMNIDNTLIIKDAVGGYDYNEHLFTWKVTVNPNKLDITDAKVVDTLEAKTSFKDLITAIDEDGNDVKDKITLTASKVTIEGNEHNVETFDLGDIKGKTYTLTFTTHLDDTQVLSQLNDTSKVFHNDVELTGTVHGDEGVTKAISNATDAANVVVKNNQIEKGGVYNPEDGSIAWTIYVNKDQVNLKGLTFVENLRESISDEKPSIQELDQDSVKIFKVGMNSDGSVNTKSEEDVTNQMNVEINGYDGFKCKIIDNDYSTYKVTFTTYLNENAENATISNEVYMQDDSGNKSENSNVSDGGYDGSFEFEKMATKNPRPKVAIRKVSTNSINTDKNQNHLLSDAEFRITAYELNLNNTLGKELTTYKKINVSVNGTAYFLNIMNKDNIVYKLEEIKAPLGYEKYAEPVFMRFTKAATTSPLTITDGNKSYAVKDIVYGANIPVSEIIIKDEPTANAKFTFVKKVPSKVEKGKVKEFTNTNTGIKFLLQPTDEKLKDNVNDRIVETDSNGIVTIDKLDPGTYKLTEILSDTNLDVGGSFTLVAAVNEDSTYSFDLTGNSNHGLSYEKDTPTNPYTLKNDYVKGTLTFKKYVKYTEGTGNQIINNNEEPLAGVEFTLTANDTTNTNAGYTKTAESGTDGTVTFANIPVGEYTLKETKKDGYEANITEYKVTVTEAEDKNNKLYAVNGIQYYGKKTDIAINPVLDTVNNNNNTLYNTPEKGKVTLTKVMNSNNTGLTGIDGKTLEDVEFGLYRKINGTVASEPVYKATSNSSGEVEFVNVEYGDYVCKEITDLPDFDRYTSEKLVDRGKVTYDASKNTFSLDLGNVQNQLYKTNVKFHKQDQDYNPLSNVKFKLYRRSSEAITNASTLTALRVSDGNKSYYPYLNNEVTSDKDGNFTLFNLPVGDYLLIENGGVSDLQDGHNMVAIYINITKISVDVKFTDNFKETLTNDHYASVDASQWSSIKSTEGTYNIENQRKFAQIQINKIYGELDGGNYTKKDYSQPLVGAKFLISTKNENKTTPLIYITTNSEGKFVYDEGKLVGEDKDGNLIKKRLYYGSYTIKEISTVNGYEVVKDEIAFDLNDDSNTASHGGTAWLVNEGKNKSEITVSNSNDQAFIDPIIRSEVLLTKLGVGENHNSLKDAEFSVKVDDDEVAKLIYNGSKDKYVLADNNETPKKVNKDNIPYLYKDGDVYKLLSGTYQVEESKTPAGYRKGSFQLDISDTDGTVKISKPENCAIDEKTNTVTDLPIALNIEKQDLSDNVLTGAEFNISGEFVDGEGTKTLSEANNLQFKPSVEYTIIETKAPNGYIQSNKTPVIIFDETGKVSISIKEPSDTITLKDELTDTIIFRNAPIQIDLLKKETGTETALGNAEFTLKGIFANTTESEITGLKTTEQEITGLKTDDKGKLSLCSSNWNFIGGNKYTLTETKAPDGYILAPDITFTVKTDGTITDISNGSTNSENKTVIVENTPITASLKKIDATNKQPIEARFNLYDVTAKTNKEFTAVNGSYDFKYLVQGHKYQITEVVTPVGYEVPKDPVIEFTVQADGTLKVGDSTIENNQIVIENIRKTGTMELIKVDSDKETVLKDAEFTLTGPDGFSEKFITNEKGTISVDNLSWGKYTLKETKAPNGYKLNAKEYDFTIDSGTLSVSFIDDQAIINQMNSIIIQKTDTDNNKLSGATFSMKDVTKDFDVDEHNKLIESVLNDQDSQVITLEGVLIGGHTYELSETKAPDGYQRVVDTVRFKMNEDGTVIKIGKWNDQYFGLDENMITVKDNPITATLEKKDDKNNLQSGVEFTITPETKSKFKNGGKDSIKFTTKDGVIVFKDILLQGNTYIVHEEKALNGYTYAKDQILHVDADGIVSWNEEKTDTVKVVDKAMDFEIIKIDDEKNPINGMEFTLKQDATENKWDIVSDKDGNLVDGKNIPLSQLLAAEASYTLIEKPKADSPYINLQGEIKFSINREGKLSVNDSDKKEEVSLQNNQLVITNTRTMVKFLKTNMEGKPLSNAKLAVYTGDDKLVSIDGKELSWETSNVVHEIRKLPQGTYTLKEIETPNGYITADSIKFTLNDKGEIIIGNDIIKDNTIVMKDELIKGHIELHKMNEQKEGLSDVVFDLYKKDIDGKDIKVAENIVTNDEGVWDSKTSNIERLDMKAKLSDGLEIGKYYFQEMKTQDGYQLPVSDKAKTEFEITGKIDDNKIVTQPDMLTKDVKNDLYTRTLEITKQDVVDQSSISDTTFTLQRIKDSAGNNVNEADDKQITIDNGKATFTLTQKGTYVLKETKPAIGYVLGEKAYEKEFTINDATPEKIVLNDNNIITNERATGTVKLLKTDSTGKEKLNHAEFKLYKDDKELGTFVTGIAYTKDSDKWIERSYDDGYLQISGLEWGNYKLVESKAPDGYKLDTTAHEFTINQEGFEKEFVDAGQIKNDTTKFTLKKTDLSGNGITGAKFTISDLTDDSKTEALQTQLDKMGSEITLSGLLIAGHTYELSETKAPNGYQRAKETITFTMQANGEIDMKETGTYSLTEDKTGIIVENAPITASIVKQNDKQQPQSGVEFTMKPAEGSKFLNEPEQQPLITDENGEIVLDGYLLQGNTYIIHEEKALNGYAYEEDRTLTVNEDGIVSWSVNGKEMDNVFTDQALKFDIVKMDDAGNKIVGKLFRLSDSHNQEWAVISNDQGVLIDQNSKQPLAEVLAAGETYTLEESEMANSPYINLHGAITFEITRDGILDNVKYHENDKVELSKDSLHLQITNVQTTANFKKVNAEGEAVVGAKLVIYADDNGKVGNKELYSWTTDKDIHTIKMLPQGSYWLKEVETPYGYITANPVQFTMDGKGEMSINNKEGSIKDQTIIMTDELVKGHFKIEKQSNQSVALSDVTFDLYHANGELIAQNLTTDQNGNWMSQGSKELSGGLEAGEYYIQETKTQDGYQLPENTKTYFTIAGKDTVGIITQPDVVSVEVENQPYQRTLDIVKKDKEDEAVIPDTMFTLQRMKDGNGKDVKEDVITKVTGEDGTLSFTMNQKGTYRLSEITPANGYVLGETPYVSEFVLDDTSAASITLEDGNIIYNERSTGVMKLIKTDDISEEALNGAVFTLYQGDKKLGDFTTGNNYTKDTSDKWIIESGEAGNLKISGLSWGEYVIKETKAADGYQLENKEASFTIGKSGTDMILEVSDIAITNLRTTFTFKKLATYVESCSDETLGSGALPKDATKVLQGAEFSAYDESGKLFASVLSDAFGNVTFEKMLANHTYTIKETKVPEGYIDHKSVYQVHIDENGQCGELIDISTNKAVKEVVNDLQRTDIVLKKVSETNPDNSIPNSVYGLYRMPKARFFRSRNADTEPQLIATAKTDQDGTLRFEGVLMNQDYMIKELIAPDGSQRSEHPITITFAMKNGEVVLTSFDDGKGTAKLDEEGNIVWYEPDVIVSFEKVDEEGNPLANATLELLDKDGKVLDTWTSNQEAHVTINLLNAGEQYMLREVKAPAGYTLAKDISFIAEEKDLGPNEQFVQKVTMQNTLSNMIVEKHDKDSGNVLEGAQFVIFDVHSMEIVKDHAGKELKWTSKGIDELVGVPAGDYILKEIIAPDGYQLAKDIAFTLTEDGVLLVDGNVVDKLVVMDEHKVEEVITPTPPIDTGDQTQVNVYLAMLSVSVMALGVLIRKLWTLNRKA